MVQKKRSSQMSSAQRTQRLSRGSSMVQNRGEFSSAGRRFRDRGDGGRGGPDCAGEQELIASVGSGGMDATTHNEDL